MTSKTKVFAAILLAFTLGAAAPVLVIWNPGGWEWADHLAGRSHATHVPANGTAEGKQLWTCGMHPQVIEDEPGNCPICGMRLVPVRDSGGAGGGMAGGESSQSGSEKGERKIRYWRAPMDPNYVSDKPGKSPMGMDLIPVYEDEQAMESGIRVDPSFLQNFAVRTAVVEKGSIPVEIRTVGVLSHNPDNLYSINTKFAGWIEKSSCNNVGQRVKKGEVLFEIYSPELVTTQQEYLAALDYVEKLSVAKSYPDAVQRARALREATRERLRYWDTTEEQITELETTRKPRRTLKIYSPASGVIIEKMGDTLEGTRVMPGMTIYKLGAHQKLWAEVQLYEHEIRYLRLGMPVRVEVDAYPGRVWSGRVVFFDSALNAQTRTLKAFVEVDNQDGKLVPQMYANILASPLAVTGAAKVPEQAILHSGERSVVIVQKAGGVFEPREVKLGPIGGGFQEVREGLSAGEMIVTSSQFLIDSESNLKAAIQQLLGAGSRTDGESEAAPNPVTHQH